LRANCIEIRHEKTRLPHWPCKMDGYRKDLCLPNKRNMLHCIVDDIKLKLYRNLLTERPYYIRWHIPGKHGPHSVLHVVQERVVRVLSESVQVACRQFGADH